MAQGFNTNLTNVALQYMQRLKVKVTKDTFKDCIEENPYYPSLYSIGNTFDKFSVENTSFNATAENLNELEPPFITYCTGQKTGKDFVLVTQITDNAVGYIAGDKRVIIVTREEFLKNWLGVVFVAEANVKSGEKDFEGKYKEAKTKTQKRRLIYTGVALLIAIAFYNLISSEIRNSIDSVVSISVIKLFGVAATILLLIYEIDNANSFVKNICTAGKHLNCDAVLNSKAGKFLGMSWAEIGFFYFTATTLLIVLPGINFSDKLTVLSFCSTLVAPYIAFSIYYQWKVVKQWCPLCLTVQAIIGSELIWSILNFLQKDFSYQIPSSGIVCAIFFCLLLPFVIWYLIKPLLLSAKDAPVYKAAHKRLLYNPETFRNLLQHQATAPEGWQQIGIDVGDSNASCTILKVCNPYCGPCAQAHAVLGEIVRRNKDVKLKIIFTASNKETDRAGEPVKHLLAIAAKGDLHLAEQALDDWYMADKKDYKVFAKNYPINGDLKMQDNKIEVMKQWCDEAAITGTPTIFINGKQLPETYSIYELKNIF